MRSIAAFAVVAILVAFMACKAGQLFDQVQADFAAKVTAIR